MNSSLLIPEALEEFEPPLLDFGKSHWIECNVCGGEGSCSDASHDAQRGDFPNFECEFCDGSGKLQVV